MKTLFLFLICLSLYCSASAQQNQIQKKPKVSKKEAVNNYRANDELLLNQIQVIGSHNSYKQAIDPPLHQYLKQSNAALADGLDYSHIPMSDQLSLGLSNLEIDLYADAKGGKYAHPKGLEWVDKSDQVKPYDPEGLMQEPGFKVFHVQDVDFRSNCLTLKKCLQELKSWSEANPGHNPVFITINAKDEVINKPDFTIPDKFTAAVFDELDKTIVENLGREKLITPDQVRGNEKTLESAVLSGKWPTLEAAKGKFIFILDETGEKRSAYIQGHPSLKGRILFANAEPGTPEAAFLILNDPIKDLIKIQDLVKKGYIVRTRADANTKEARSNDKRMFEAARRSGAQIITTDYYAPSTHFKSDYKISFDDGKYFQVNPLHKNTKK